MPRPIVYGNGRLLVALDARLRIRELFYPQVGQYDHLGGRAIRMGAWANGHFSWLDADDWTRTMAYETATLCGVLSAVDTRLGVSIEFQEGVLPDRPAFVRLMRVKNLTHLPLDVRLFFNHDLAIAESDTGQTALYHPEADALIHYKGSHAFLFGGRTESQHATSYHTAVKGYGGQDGSWQDAEDGVLDMNPICQGSIDSTLGLRLTLSPGEQQEASYSIVAGASIVEVVADYASLRRKSPSMWLRGLSQASRASCRCCEACLKGLPRPVAEFCEQSLLILLTQIDHKGAILAANDSDIMVSNRAHYSYVWPRDGALVAQVLDRFGLHGHSERFFDYCLELEPTVGGLFLQKYQVDGSLGASWHPWVGAGAPVQEDETALTLLALRDHLRASGGLAEARTELRGFATTMAEGLLAFRDPTTALPLPSYDLWEERRGVHTFTVASVIVGLEAGADLFAAWTNQELANRCATAAQAMREAMMARLFDPKEAAFVRGLKADGTPDKEPDASTLLVGLVGALPMDHPAVAANAEFVRRKLAVRTEVGGLARYDGDWYWRQPDSLFIDPPPGNPWIITTLWLAQTQITIAKRPAELEEPLETIRWAMRLAGPTGVLPEQVHPLTGEHLSVSPLTWSHAELLRTAMDWCERAALLGGAAS